MKYTINSLKSLTPSKTFLLVSLAVLVILGTFLYGAYRKVQLDHAQAQTQAAQAAAVQAQKDATDKAFKQAQTELQVQHNKADAACLALKQYSLATATKKLVSYPPVCNVN